ncbi:MAG: A/G-specific adenine glycosylase [Candidatus Pacebacteria bacterium]|nr:A/G-specific adenine glycosylase [Candidatus Paceibacterota bacterium]
MEYYGEYGRHDLPWRKKQSPYYVAVSEIMLQQTQVDRVIPFFKNWMKQFSSWKVLANAQQSDVLRAWKGLGYNSRALRLQKLAQVVTNDYKGRLPKDFEELKKLPSIGPYTAGAIRAFAFNEYTPLIETNIRRIFIHHFFKGESNITDTDIFEIMDDMGEIENAQQWYAALMDYGSTLPKIIKYNPNKQSKHYTKQSKFQGSDRQIRGKILDILLKNKKLSKEKVFEQLGDESERYQKIADQLEKENFIKQTKKSLILK